MRRHLDFETRCEVDLRKHGLRRYVEHPSFEIILTAWADDDGPVQQCEGFEGFRKYLDSTPLPNTWHAFNAPFEIACLRREGVQIALQRWRCAMAHAYARAFSGGLANVCDQVCVPEQFAKMKEGSRLIPKFCTPRRPSKTNKGLFWAPETAPEDWGRFKQYNRLDVEAERAIWCVLDAWPWTEEEQFKWMLDREINSNGVPVDLRMVENAIAVAARMKHKINARGRDLTGGVSLSQVGELLLWCRARGYPLSDLKADTIRGFLMEDLSDGGNPR